MSKGKNKKQSNAKRFLAKLVELNNAGVSICFDAVSKEYKQVTAYPSGKADVMDHHHYEGESWDEILDKVHKDYIKDK